ncbi:hypothetical protein [Amycolatopsis sp. NPDC004079]|uniref:hypothetical protein n=1 Tax=Amycolatopsis sp. NPDC004079 TaxID=3154549 RepID=UPI0033B8FC15
MLDRMWSQPAVDVFVLALATMRAAIAQVQPDKAWKQSVAHAAREWQDQRSAVLV